MQAEHTFVRDETFPSWFANAIQEALSVLAFGFQLTQLDATHVQVVAGANDQAAVIAIGGAWRWNEATVTRALPGGAAGVYPVFVTAANDNIVSSPNPYTDATNRAFALAVVAPGATPPIVAGTVDRYRLVGYVVWDGVKISGIRQTVPAGKYDGPAPTRAYRTATTSPGGGLVWTPVTLDTVDFDDDGCWQASAYHVPIAGIYRVSGQLQVGASSSPTVINAGVLKSAGGGAWNLLRAGSPNVVPAAFDAAAATFGTLIRLAAGDIIVPGIRSSENPLVIGAPASSANYFEVQRVA